MDIKAFCYSETALRHGIDNTPSPDVIENTEWLYKKILDPLEYILGVKVNITSGYRSPEVNALIGGSTTSQHCLGQAADINVNNYTPQDLFLFIKQKTQLPYDQLILEFPPAGWVHISYSRQQRRSQRFIADKINGKTIYTPG